MTPGRAGPIGRVGLVGVVLLTSLLSSCGGHQDYCDTVRSHQSEIGSAARNGDPTGALQLLPAFQDLQSAAPDDVQDDYQVVVTRLTALRTALDDAGVDASSYDPKHPPPGLAPSQRAAIRRAAAELAAPDVAQALATVQQEVLDVCHVPLEL
jgi:hypothetical protein